MLHEVNSILISAVILTRNEDKNIAACIESVSWCDEVLVIDDKSTDRTQEIAKSLNAKIYERPLGGDYASQRNFGLEKAQGDWVLFIDADERISQSLAFEIQAQTSSTIFVQGFYMKRLDTMWRRQLKYGETGNIKLLRLARKHAGSWIGKIHETWKVKGQTEVLNNPLLHSPHPTITEFLQEINTYTTIRAKELFDRKTKVTVLDVIFYPKAKFFVNYFLRLGLLDGIPGLLLAIMMSMHSFLVRGKLWILWHKK